MQLQKLPDGSVRISRMNAWDVQTFRNLPTLADYTADPKSEKRLLPPPAGDADLSPEMAMDWVEFVVPELRESFAHNLSIVLEDLGTLSLDHSAQKNQSSNGSGPAPAADASPTGKEVGAPFDDPDDEFQDDDDDESEAFSGGYIPLPGFGSDGDESIGTGSGTGSESAAENQHYTLTIPPGHAEAWFRALNQARIVLSTRYGIDSEHIPDLAKLLVAGEIEFWFQYELFVNLQGWLVEVVLNPE